MPTYENPIADVSDAADALQGLAHAARHFSDPADTYRVTGHIVSGVRALRQVLDQLASIHAERRDRVSTDDRDRQAGSEIALFAADEFHQAATLIEQACGHLDQAWQQSGRIVWHPAPAEQWASIVFLQGDEADVVLDMIDRSGPDAAIEHLSQWDYGEETTNAATINGHVYDTPPSGSSDRVVAEGRYMLTYNPDYGYVSLLRNLNDPSQPSAKEVAEPAARPVAGTGAGGSWFGRTVAGAATGLGLSL